MAVFKNCRLVTGAICKASNQNYLFEVKEWFFTLARARARRMPQGGEKPAPSSLTNFKSIGYQYGFTRTGSAQTYANLCPSTRKARVDGAPLG
jgi:hypothetical protein